MIVHGQRHERSFRQQRREESAMLRPERHRGRDAEGGTMFVWMGRLALLGAVAFAVYRLSLSVRYVRASRAGDRERAESLQTTGNQAFLAFAFALTLFFLVGVVVALALR
jgi:hypothetical protein